MHRRHFFRVLIAGAVASHVTPQAEAVGFISGSIGRRVPFDHTVGILHGREHVLTLADCEHLLRQGIGMEAEMSVVEAFPTGRLRFVKDGAPASEWFERPTW